MNAKEFLDSAERLMENGEEFTGGQWIEFMEKYDEMKDLPAAWWSSLLKEDSNE